MKYGSEELFEVSAQFLAVFAAEIIVIKPVDTQNVVNLLKILAENHEKEIQVDVMSVLTHLSLNDSLSCIVMEHGLHNIAI